MPVTARRLSRRAADFRRDRSGNAAMLFALSALPAFGLLAFSIDHGIGLNAKFKLDAAADAASMVAINAAKNVISNSSSSGSSVTAAALAEGKRQGLLAFAANAGSIGFTSVPTPDIQVARVNQKLTATVTYSTQSLTQISSMVGLRQIAMGGTSISTLTMPTYINYYIVVDNSQSMGVGSTPTDMQALYDRVVKYSNYDSAANASSKTGCVFGCHVPQSGSYNQIDSNENVAHAIGSKYSGETYINLRIDAARDAIKAILGDAAQANASSGLNLVQIGVYTMQQDPTTANSYIKTLVDPPSSNFASMSTSSYSGPVDKMDLGNNTGAGIGDTGFSSSLNDFAQNRLPMQGDGSTAASPLNYVFLITDGVFDTPGGSCTYGHCTGALDDSLCTQLKSKSTVGVIYTTYNPVYNANDASKGYQDAYYKLVLPAANAIAPNLQACASSSQYYFEATDGPSITTGMQQLFAPSLQAARLSQ